MARRGTRCGSTQCMVAARSLEGRPNIWRTIWQDAIRGKR